MVELVEAATQGALSEVVLMECLTVNDRLLKFLADIDTYAFTETTATTTAAAAPVKTAEQEFGELFLEDDSSEQKVPPAPIRGGGKTTGEDDPFAGAADMLSAPADDGKMQAAPVGDSKLAAQPKDDFDDFFAGRTGGD
jgi:hypothetical protein